MASATIFTAVMTVALLFLTTATQAQNTSCVQNLLPCADYLNTTTTPPDNCCNSIRDAVTNELACLCNLYNTPGLLESINLNVTQAIDLTRRCGVNAGLSACNQGGVDSPTSSPPGIPGNGGSTMTWNVFSSLLLLCAAMLSN